MQFEKMGFDVWITGSIFGLIAEEGNCCSPTIGECYDLCVAQVKVPTVKKLLRFCDNAL